MKAICIYHTRSGISEQIAKQISSALDAELMAISDSKSYKGFFGYIAAAIVGLKKKLPEISPCNPAFSLEEYDKIIAVAPIWCENVSPVMRAFLAQNKNRFRGELSYVICSMSGISYKEKIDALCELTGKPYKALLQVKTHKHDWKAEVADFIKKLGA